MSNATGVQIPDALSGVITPTHGGVFTNGLGEYIVEPITDGQGELILVRADGSTATLRGDWETGWEA